MKKISLIIATLIACGAFTALEIQAQQGNRTPRRGTNQVMMPRAMSSEQRVKMFTDTLKLTEEQQTQLKAVFDEQSEAMGKLGSSLSREERMEAMTKLRTEQTAKIKKILTEEQYKTYTSSRLGQGFGGGQNMAQMTPAQRVERIATQLKLTDEQKTKLTECLVAQEKEAAELRTKTQSMTPAERRTAMQEQRTKTQDQIKEILGEDLYKEYQKIGARFGQQQPTQPGQRGQMTPPQGQRGQMMTPAQQVERMSRTLTLTDDQKTELTKFFEAQNTAMQNQREKMQSLSNTERRELMQKNRTEMETKLKEILGEEEYTKYQSSLRQQRGPGNMGQRPQRGQGQNR